MRTNPAIFAMHTWTGAVLALAISFTAFRVGALTGGGAAAATVVGTLAAAAGLPWAVIVILFFLSSTALSRLGLAAKHVRSGDRMAKTGARDAVQVLANGGVFAIAAAAYAIAPRAPFVIMVRSFDAPIPTFAIAAMGALAAATSDTWATEVGMLASAAPRSIISMRRVPIGTSGGVTLVGVIAGAAGAYAIAVAARWLGIVHDVVLPVAIGGVGGMLVDSIVGATLQSQRHCDKCDQPTERIVHRCGSLTRQTRGLGWLNNDGVNAIATVSGAMIAVLAAGTLAVRF